MLKIRLYEFKIRSWFTDGNDRKRLPGNGIDTHVHVYSMAVIKIPVSTKS